MGHKCCHAKKLRKLKSELDKLEAKEETILEKIDEVIEDMENEDDNG